MMKDDQGSLHVTGSKNTEIYSDDNSTRLSNKIYSTLLNDLQTWSRRFNHGEIG